MKKIKKAKRNKKKQMLQDIPIVRYQTDKEHGLSEEQINERIEHKLVNDTKIKTSNSYLQIFCKNIFTIFNIIWLVIAIALMCVNAWSDLLFLFVVIANTAISIFQEIKAKIAVEKLSMVTAPKIKVIRMGLQLEVKGEDLLLDDIIVLENGNQIPADCIIIEGNVEANESLLTGESNLIKKQEGDYLLAGSFLVSGLCYARVDKVGKNNYIQTVAERTKDFKPQTSNLFKDLNSLIKIIIIILIPVGVLTCFKEIYMADSTIEEAITSTSGALTGMIPAGMYLLITVGLSVGVIKLGSIERLGSKLVTVEGQLLQLLSLLQIGVVAILGPQLLAGHTKLVDKDLQLGNDRFNDLLDPSEEAGNGRLDGIKALLRELAHSRLIHNAGANLAGYRLNQSIVVSTRDLKTLDLRLHDDNGERGHALIQAQLRIFINKVCATATKSARLREQHQISDIHILCTSLFSNCTIANTC